MEGRDLLLCGFVDEDQETLCWSLRPFLRFHFCLFNRHRYACKALGDIKRSVTEASCYTSRYHCFPYPPTPNLLLLTFSLLSMCGPRGEIKPNIIKASYNIDLDHY
jgi:hypothetical protein